MKKTIKTTLIDTGGHGYLSVSKKDIILVIDDLSQISTFSGLDFNRVYLEEDCDATLFINKATEKGFEVIVKSGYNLNFKITHNYNHKLFSLKGEIGETFKMYDDLTYTIINIVNDVRIVENSKGDRYRLLKTNPFVHIKDSVN